MVKSGDPELVQPNLWPDGHWLDLRLLSQFLLVCDNRSMSAAGRKLGITTAAVSQAIVRLERQFDVQLFDRHSGGIRTTPAGSELRDRARRLLADANQTVAALGSFREKVVPRLRLLVVERASNYLVPALVPYLDKLVGDLAITTERGDYFADDLRSGKHDIVISSEAIESIVELEHHEVCSEELLILVHKSLPPAQRTLDYLLRHVPFLSKGGLVKRPDPAIDEFVSRLPAPMRAIQCDSTPPILELISSGFGWTIAAPMTAFALQPDFSNIALVPIGHLVPRRTIHVVAEQQRFGDIPAELARISRRALAAQRAAWRDAYGDVILTAITVPPEADIAQRKVRKSAPDPVS